MNRADIIAEAQRWIGTPFQHQAALRGIACDCSGLVLGVMQALGSTLASELLSPANRAYDRTPDPQQLRDGLERYCVPVAYAEALPGDILFMSCAGQEQHVGFLSSRDPDCMIHGYNAARKVVEHSINSVWRRRIVGVYCIRELA